MRIAVTTIISGFILFVLINLVKVHQVPTNEIDNERVSQSREKQRLQQVVSSKTGSRSGLIDVKETAPSLQDVEFDRRARELVERDGIDYSVALHQLHELWLLDQPQKGPITTLSGPAYRIIMRMDEEEIARVVSGLPAGSLRGTVIFSNKLSDETNWKLYDAMSESRDRAGLASLIVANNYHRKGVNDATQAIARISNTTDAKAAASSLISKITISILLPGQGVIKGSEENGHPNSKSLQESISDLSYFQQFIVGHGIMSKDEVVNWNDSSFPDDIKIQLR